MAFVHYLAAMLLSQTAEQPVPEEPAVSSREAGDSGQLVAQEAPAGEGQGATNEGSLVSEQAPVQEPANTGLAATVPSPLYYPAQPEARPATPCSAQGCSLEASPDPRIRLIRYDPDQIVTLGVSPGYASVIELADDERVENVVVGNSAAWQVSANRRGERIIVKPLAGAAQTNMIVLTGTRRYVFMLDPYGETSFIMRFSYPQPVQSAVAAVAQPTYKFSGDKALFPLAMSDDGRRTVIRWGVQSPLPAVSAMVGGKQEQLVNGRMVGDDFVIEGAAPRYKFRYGRNEAVAIRRTLKRRP